MKRGMKAGQKRQRRMIPDLPRVPVAHVQIQRTMVLYFRLRRVSRGRLVRSRCEQMGVLIPGGESFFQGSLNPQPARDLFPVLSQIEYSHDYDSLRLWGVEDPVRKFMHDLPPDRGVIKGSNFRME